MLSFSVRHSLSDVLPDFSRDSICCSTSPDGYAILYRRFASKIRFFQFTFQPPSLRKVCSTALCSVVTDAVLSPNKRFLFFTTESSVRIIDTATKAGHTLEISDVHICFPVVSNAQQTFYIYEQGRSLFLNSVVGRAVPVLSSKTGSRVIRNVTWWTFNGTHRNILVISGSKIFVYEFVDNSFNKCFDLPWADSVIPTRFDVISSTDFLLTFISISEVSFMLLPSRRTARIELKGQFSYSQLGMMFISSTILMVSVPRLLLALIDVGGSDLRLFLFDNEPVLAFETPKILLPVSSDSRVFFSPDSLSFIVGEYDFRSLMRSALQFGKDWRGVGHLIGAHYPFALFAREIIDFALRLNNPIGIFQLLSEFSIGFQYLKAEQLLLLRFVSHEFVPESLVYAPEAEVRAFLRTQVEIVRNPTIEGQLKALDSLCSPVRFWNTPTIYLKNRGVDDGAEAAPLQVLVSTVGVVRESDEAGDEGAAD
jgi:hypothetical protein